MEINWIWPTKISHKTLWFLFSREESPVFRPIIICDLHVASSRFGYACNVTLSWQTPFSAAFSVIVNTSNRHFEDCCRKTFIELLAHTNNTVGTWKMVSQLNIAFQKEKKAFIRNKSSLPSHLHFFVHQFCEFWLR